MRNPTLLFISSWTVLSGCRKSSAPPQASHVRAGGAGCWCWPAVGAAAQDIVRFWAAGFSFSFFFIQILDCFFGSGAFAGVEQGSLGVSKLLVSCILCSG